jgi:NADPH2:quinone reductase
MKAIVCRNFAPISHLEWAEVPLPVPQHGEVRVTLRAAALNFLDTLIVQGRYQFKPPLPFIPGAEMAGVVSAVAEGDEAHKVGDAVIVRSRYGCLAQEVVADLANVVPIETPQDWSAVAALSLAYTTAYHALVHRGGVRPDETVLVLGAAGGVGIAAIQVAKALGAKVIAACSGVQRAAACRRAGADATVDYARGDLRAQLRAMTADVGVQVVVDAVGGEHADPALRSLSKQGRYLIVGFAAGTIPRLAANLLLLKGASAIGVNADFAREDRCLYLQTMDTLLSWLKQGTITPLIGATFALERSVEAMERLANREFTGKVVIVP